jgi:hypothetical protein
MTNQIQVELAAAAAAAAASLNAWKEMNGRKQKILRAK